MVFKLISVGLLLISLESICLAQVYGGVVGEGEIEIGYASRRFHREVRYAEVTQVESFTQSFPFVSYGFTPWLSSSLQFNIADPGDLGFVGRDYRIYHLGFSLTSRFHFLSNLCFQGSFNYSDQLYFDKSQSGLNKNTEALTIFVGISYNLVILEQVLLLYSGPAYVSERTIQYGFGAVSSGDSPNHGAVLIGANLLLLNHLNVLSNVTISRYRQFTVGFAFKI